jgi:hypothetical protein
MSAVVALGEPAGIAARLSAIRMKGPSTVASTDAASPAWTACAPALPKTR